MDTIFYSKNRFFIVLILSILLLLFLFFGFYNDLVALLILGAFFLILVFFLKPLWGVYLTALFLAVNGLAVNFKFLEIPFIDLLALIVTISFFIRQIYLYFFSKTKKEKIKFPLGVFFFLFFGVVCLSSLFSSNILSSLWYSFRWILFFYLVFVVVPFNLIKNLKVLKRVIILVVISGLFVAVMGLISLFFQDWSDYFFRVRPLPILGDWVFGENYNLLAEFLIMSTFLVLSLKYWFKEENQKKMINLIAGFFIVITFLTFGRTAWMAIVFQVLLYFIISNFVIGKKRINSKEVVLFLFLSLILLAPFLVKMISLQEANISSTQNRLLLTKISVASFMERPFLGNGSGSFVSLVANNIRFVAKYGDPLDSHGFGQKILAENGILGLITFLLFLLVIIKKIYQAVLQHKEYQELLLPLFIASFGGFFYQVFNTSYYKGRLWFQIALALVAVNLVISKKEKINYEKK